MKRSGVHKLPDDVRNAVDYIKNGKPLPSKVTRYAGKIKVEVIENGITTWSLEDEIQRLTEIRIEKIRTTAKLIRTIMESLGQGDEGFAELFGIKVGTIRSWKQGGREPSGPSKKLLDVSIRHPQILLETVKESEAEYA